MEVINIPPRPSRFAIGVREEVSSRPRLARYRDGHCPATSAFRGDDGLEDAVLDLDAPDVVGGTSDLQIHEYDLCLHIKVEALVGQIIVAPGARTEIKNEVVVLRCVDGADRTLNPHTL